MVTKPNQYLGNELNIYLKDPSEVELKLILAYPDTYFIGMSHQGLKILYHILNRREDALAERVYAPWVDMESQMRKRGIPLFSVESQTPVREFDVLGFTLQHELNFSNLLNMLDLAGIPLRTRDRDHTYPLILAGGSCASNPEPLAEFVDAFVIGDGEDVVGEIADLLIRGKKDGWGRLETLRALASLGGIYVPALYRAEYDEQGRFRALIPLDDDVPEKIKARIIERLELKHYALHPLVPLTEIAHDRLSIEIMRGCSQGCRYCHAGMVYRPVREKAPEDVLKEVVSGIASSGWDEISLVSLSSSDYGCLMQVISEINCLMAGKMVALSLPSMRPDTFSKDLAQAIKNVRRTGLTFAPESGTSRLRKVINKSFREEDLLDTLRIAFENGWNSVKLYFMIGLPTETVDDLNGIVELGWKVQRLSRSQRKKDLHLSISPFTPKPHTPFQWESQDPVEVLLKKSHYVKSRLPKKGMRVKWRDPHVSFLEGVFARGDRRLGQVLELAWRDGCAFDSWTERFRYDRWTAAFAKAGIDPQTYSAQWPLDRPLPWDHIEYGVRRQFLRDEREKALKGQLTKDCRENGCHGCGAHRGGLARSEGSRGEGAIREVKPSPDYGRGNKQRGGNRPWEVRSRMRVHYAKLPPLQFLSHLDLIRAFERAMRRTNLPLAYTEGFHPHPKIAFGPPLTLGFTSRAEYLDIQFAKPVMDDLMQRLGASLPRGIELLAAKVIFRKTESLNSAINMVEYIADLGHLTLAGNLQEILDGLLQAEQLLVKRVSPKQTKQVDIREQLVDLRLEQKSGVSLMKMRLRVGGGGHARPQEVLTLALALSEEELLSVPIQRVNQFIERSGRLMSPLEAI